MSMVDEPLMLRESLPAVHTIHPESKKLVTGVNQNLMTALTLVRSLTWRDDLSVWLGKGCAFRKVYLP